MLRTKSANRGGRGHDRNEDMLLDVEVARVKEPADRAPSRYISRCFTKDEGDDFQEDGVHQDSLRLEVKDLSNDCSEAGESHTQKEGTEGVGAQVWVIGDIERFGDQLQGAIEDDIVGDVSNRFIDAVILVYPRFG